MTTVLLSIHVLAAIVLIGPITVAASLFPRYARAAAGALPGQDGHGESAGPVAVAQAMHRISRGYAAPALVVPVFGIATAARMHVLGQTWLWISMILTAAAALLLIARIVPGQRRVLDALIRQRPDPTSPAGAEDPGGDGARTTVSVPVSATVLSRLGMTTGLFALTWAVVVVLMILRPGSTTGVGR